MGFLPAWIEFPLLVVGLVWFINLTNFMDGLDWLTVSEFVPVTLALAVLAALGAAPGHVGLIAIVLAGALIGFAPHNRHVAQVFLGDVGSLAIGGLVGWMLISLAGNGHIAAALLLPLYYLADATVTLWRRYQRGERLSEAHKSHFYQLAHQRGLSVEGVTDRIFALNVVLAVLAVLTVLAGSLIVSALGLVAGGMLTAALLGHFERGGV
jgi:UDP-N-acetylmuramyl pentapeptide phosphotransferase/UDP-N-acetylglucosamine-1-phosphate transferase